MPSRMSQESQKYIDMAHQKPTKQCLTLNLGLLGAIIFVINSKKDVSASARLEDSIDPDSVHCASL